jgi:hypothetical protein
MYLFIVSYSDHDPVKIPCATSLSSELKSVIYIADQIGKRTSIQVIKRI